MKTILPLLVTLMALPLLSGCTDSEASSSHAATPTPENGAQFKKGEGLALTDEMKRSIGLKTVEVEERKFAGAIPIELRPHAGSKDLSGWLPADQSEKVTVGSPVVLRDNPQKKLLVKAVIKSHAGFGESEVVVEGQPNIEGGSGLDSVITLEESEAAASIPRSALLSTAEGNFVYTTNGKFYVRTPVKTGVVTDEFVEIIDGLYSGDEVVAAPVMSLWVAELQILRGGKACTCGH